MNRDDALKLMNEYTQSESLRRHMRCVEIAMIAYAKLWNEDELKWGIVGLLHDFDYERWPDPPHHPMEGSKILTDLGYPEDVIYAIKSHANYIVECPRISQMDKTLFAVDELCGFIVAVAMVRPEGLIGMTPKSVRKKMKTASFAASVSRDDMVDGASELDVELNEHIRFVIDALEVHAKELDLAAATA